MSPSPSTLATVMSGAESTVGLSVEGCDDACAGLRPRVWPAGLVAARVSGRASNKGSLGVMGWGEVDADDGEAERVFKILGDWTVEETQAEGRGEAVVVAVDGGGESEFMNCWKRDIRPPSNAR